MYLGEAPVRSSPRSTGAKDAGVPGARLRGDRLRRRVRLLGRDPALLERERGHVTGGVDVLETRDAAVPVRRGEPVAIWGRPRDRRALADGEADHAVDHEVAVRDQLSLPFAYALGYAGQDGDPAHGEQARGRGARVDPNSPSGWSSCVTRISSVADSRGRGLAEVSSASS